MTEPKTTIEWAWKELGIEKTERKKLKAITSQKWLELFDKQMYQAIQLTHKVKKLKRALREIANVEAVTVIGSRNPMAEEFINHVLEPLKRQAQDALDSCEP